MSSALTLIVLGQAYFLGPIPTVSPGGANRIWIPNTNQLLTTNRLNYTYTPGVGSHKVHTKATTWREALQICHEEGGHLAIINSHAEADAIAQLFTKAGSHVGSFNSDYAWIGIHDLISHRGDYETIFGDSLAQAGYDSWHEPKSLEGPYCGATYRNGELSWSGCLGRLGFICELPYDQRLPSSNGAHSLANKDATWWIREALANKVAGTSPVLNTLHNNQPVQKSVSNSNNFTYTPGIGAHRVPSRIATWNTARRICKELGSHLAIINSVAEAEAIIQLLKQSDIPRAWLGVHDLYKEDEFITIHGESLAEAGYDTWRAREPNNKNDEDCVMVDSDGKLNDLPCEYTINFICELPQVQSCKLQVSAHSGSPSISDYIIPELA